MAITCVRLFTLATLLVLTTVSPIHADEFGFFIGNGYGGHHHRGGGWGVGYSSWYPPPPRYVYVQPPPVIQERVYVQPQVVQERIIVQPQAPAPAPATYAPSTFSSRTNSLPAPPNRDTVDSPVVIRNTAGKNAPVAFLVDSKDEELNEGQSRTFSGNGNRVIEFDRGGDRGTARYELTGGVYSFVVTNNGWDLVKETGVPQTAKRPVLRRNELPTDSQVR